MFTRPLAAQGRPRRSPDHNTPPADVTASPPRAPRRSRVEYSARAALAASSPAHRRALRPDGPGRGFGTRPRSRPARHAPRGHAPLGGTAPGGREGARGTMGVRGAGNGRDGVLRPPGWAGWCRGTRTVRNGGGARPGPPTGDRTKRAVSGVGDRPHEPPVPAPVVPRSCPRTDAVARAARRRRRCGNASPSRRRGCDRQNGAARPPVLLCRQPRLRCQRGGEVTRG